MFNLGGALLSRVGYLGASTGSGAGTGAHSGTGAAAGAGAIGAPAGPAGLGGERILSS